MAFELRLLIVVCTAFACANVAGSIWAAWLWRRERQRDTADADALKRLRFLPLTVAVATAAWAALSFLIFEPRDQDETMGVVLKACAAFSVALFVVSMWRLTLLLVRARRIRCAWRVPSNRIDVGDFPVPAYVVDSAFPVVAVVGVFKPMLIIARQVLAECTPDQLAVILAHERSHLRRRDNLTRLMLAILPDVFAWLPASRRLSTAWHQAAENAADDAVVHARTDGPLVLAETLIRVARLVPTGTPPLALPASALYRGEPLEQRVRRLLTPHSAPAAGRDERRRMNWFTIAAMLGGSVLLLTHDLVEAAVAFLP